MNLDGLNRYLAIVRLTLIYFNYREYDRLDKIYDDLDGMMRGGQFYSRRILLNYYANRVMLHSKRNELEKASVYGYLSIRQHSGDYLHYVNNLCGCFTPAKPEFESPEANAGLVSGIKKHQKPPQQGRVCFVLHQGTE